jgi:hypothetical protein
MASDLFGIKGELLPDGSRLIRETILEAGQRLSMATDHAILTKMNSHRTLARALNLACRAIVVVVGLVLAYVVVTNRISLVAAAVFALILLFVPDLFTRVNKLITGIGDRMVTGLVMAEAFFEHAGGQLHALTQDEKLSRYFALLGSGEVDLGRQRIRLVREPDGSARLLTVAM